MREIVLILPNIRSSENVGAMFRTADAFGVNHLYCIGYTPLPVDRFCRPNMKLVKTSLGAENSVSWSHHETVEMLLLKLKDEGFEVVALEQDSKSENIFQAKNISSKIALIVGNEIEGVVQTIREQADRIFEIPMMGEKESLNVSVSAGIALAVLRYLTK